jgi:hypothetical protein
MKTTNQTDSSAAIAQRSPTREFQLPSGGYRSFHSAFEGALRVTIGTARPREIRVRRNSADDSYTWTIEY